MLCDYFKAITWMWLKTNTVTNVSCLLMTKEKKNICLWRLFTLIIKADFVQVQMFIQLVDFLKHYLTNSSLVIRRMLVILLLIFLFGLRITQGKNQFLLLCSEIVVHQRILNIESSAFISSVMINWKFHLQWRILKSEDAGHSFCLSP